VHEFPDQPRAGGTIELDALARDRFHLMAPDIF
jgi:hypothetical protein